MPYDDDDERISPELEAEVEELLRNPPGEEEQRKLDAMERRAKRVKKFGKNAGDPKNDRTVTVSLRVNTTIKTQLDYWSDKRELTITEYVTDAVREKIARENGDLDLPDIYAGRQAQLIDAVKTLITTIDNMDKSFTSMLESIVILSRDPQYMVEASRSVENG